MASTGSPDVVLEWGAPTLGLVDFGNEERRLLHESVLEALANCKRPTAYLYHHMPCAAEKKASLEHLLLTFPLQDDVIYCLDTPIPSVEQEKLWGGSAVCVPCGCFRIWG
jgi:hypothetical protein